MEYSVGPSKGMIISVTTNQLAMPGATFERSNPRSQAEWLRTGPNNGEGHVNYIRDLQGWLQVLRAATAVEGVRYI